MDSAERENLKRKIEADMMLLYEKSWLTDVKDKLIDILRQFESVMLEGYDD